MGFALSSRSPAIRPIRAGGSTGSCALVYAAWHALTAVFRTASPPSVSPPFLAAAAARRQAPDLNSALALLHPAIKTVASHALHTTANSQKQCQTVVKASSQRRLKVVREFDAGISPSCAGRMVISGRMADVCAELDRMTQKESVAQFG